MSIRDQRTRYTFNANNIFNLTNVVADTHDRFRHWISGLMEWGSGSAAPDVNLYRSAADVLKTDDVLDALGFKANGTALTDNLTFSPAAGGTNVCEVTITLKDPNASTVAAPRPFILWLSDASTGVGLTAVTASGAVAAKTASGTDFAALTSKKALLVQPLASGVYILSITDTAKTGFYVCAQDPFTGKVSVSSQLVTGNYG